MLRVGIEPNLSNIKDYLQNKGCQVSVLENSATNLNSFDAIVVTGQNDNVMGMEDTTTNTPIIECAGLTPQEVYYRIEDATR